MEFGRLKYEKPSNYCTKVKLGNWFEDTCHYVKQRHPISTTYQRHYLPKFPKIDSGEIWDRIFDGEGVDPRVLIDHGGSKYWENFSTTYDLAYNHFPKYFGGPIHRVVRFRLERAEPEEEFMENFGNITRYGFVEYKREQWRCEKTDPRLTSTSLYKDTYLWPNVKPVRPTPKKQKDRKECNPITWECCPEKQKWARCVPQQ